MIKTWLSMLTLMLSLIVCVNCEIALAQEEQTGPPTQPDIGAQSTPYSLGTVLRVNDDALTSSQIITPIRSQLENLAIKLSPKEFVENSRAPIMQATMGNLYQLLLFQHARKDLEKIENLDEVIDNAMAKQKKAILAQYAGSAAKAQADLAQKGSSLDEVMENARRELIINSYREMNFLPNLEITRNQMLQYYRKNLKKNYQVSSSIQFRLIDIKISEFLSNSHKTNPTQSQLVEARILAQKSAQDALDLLHKGSDFSQIAEKYSHGFRKSQGGLWQARDPSSLREQYQPVVSALLKIKPGEITDILPGDERFFIAQLVDLQNARTIPFSEAQKQIREQLRELRWKKFSAKLSRELLDKATMGDMDKFIYETALAAYYQLNQ